jgi:hypothetical protein
MKLTHVAALIVAFIFAFYKTGTAMVHPPDFRNYAWAAISWALLAGAVVLARHQWRRNS